MLLHTACKCMNGGKGLLNKINYYGKYGPIMKRIMLDYETPIKYSWLSHESTTQS